jgi:hypothetical protein
MPFLDVPYIFFNNTPVIDQARLGKDKAYIASLKKQIVEALLKAKDGSILAKLGDCDAQGNKVNCRLSQEGLNKLRDELGTLGIASTIIKGEVMDSKTHRYPIYLFATYGPTTSKVSK